MSKSFFVQDMSNNLLSLNLYEFLHLYCIKENDFYKINNPKNLEISTHVVLPGQGAFKTCMDGIKKIPGMEDELNKFVKIKQRPLLQNLLPLFVGPSLKTCP